MALPLNILLFDLIPVEFRLLLITVVFLSLAAIMMSSFAAFLFYKFYRDTIKPIPLLQHEHSSNTATLKLLNNGHSAFYIFKVFFSKSNKVSSSIFDFLPAVHEEELYAMFTKSIEGRKLMPDQQMKLFEIDFSYLKATLSEEKIQSLRDHLDGVVVEIHCHDIGKRYTSVTRKALELK